MSRMHWAVYASLLVCLSFAAITVAHGQEAGHDNASLLVVAQGALYEVNCANGDRRTLSGYQVGDGPHLGFPVGLALTSQETACVLTQAWSGNGPFGIIDVNLATGDRTLISSAAVWSHQRTSPLQKVDREDPNRGDGPKFTKPTGVVFHAGRLLVADEAGLIEIDLESGDRSIIWTSPVFNKTAPRLLGPLAADAHGCLLAVMLIGQNSAGVGGLSALVEVDIDGGGYDLVYPEKLPDLPLRSGQRVKTSLDLPRGIAVEDDSHVIVAHKSQLLRIDRKSASVTDSWSVNAEGIPPALKSGPGQPVVGPQGQIWQLYSGGVAQIDAATGNRSEFSTHTTGQGPRMGHVAAAVVRTVGSAPDLTAPPIQPGDYLAAVGDALVRIDPGARTYRVVSGNVDAEPPVGEGPMWSNMSFLEVDSRGAIYVVDRSQTLYQVDPASGRRNSVSLRPDTTAGPALSFQHMALAADRLFDVMSGQVIEVDPQTGDRHQVALDKLYGVQGVCSLGTHELSAVAVAGGTTGVARINPATSESSWIAKFPRSTDAIAVSGTPEGDRVYVLTRENLFQVSARDGKIETIDAISSLKAPYRLAAVPGGGLLVAYQPTSTTSAVVKFDTRTWTSEVVCDATPDRMPIQGLRQLRVVPIAVERGEADFVVDSSRTAPDSDHDAKTVPLGHFVPGTVPPARQIAFLPDGKELILLQPDGGVVVLTIATGELRSVLEPDPNRSALIVASAEQLIAAEAQTVRVCELPTGQILAELQHADAVSALCLVAGGDKSYLATAVDRTVHLWDLTTGRETASEDWEAAVISLAAAPDGEQLVLGGDKRYAFWSLDDGKIGQRGKTYGYLDDPVRSMAYSPDGAHVIAVMEGTAINSIRQAALLDVHSEELEIPTDFPFHRTGGPVSHRPLSATFASPTLIVASCENGLVAWDIQTRRKVALRQDAVGLVALSCSSDGQKVAASRLPVGSETRVGEHLEEPQAGPGVIWDLAEFLSPATPITELPFGERAAALAFSPDGSTLVVGGAQRDAKNNRIGLLQVVDVSDPSQTKPIATVPPSADVRIYQCVNISPDGKKLVAGGMWKPQAAAVLEWSFPKVSSKPRAWTTKGLKDVTSLAFSPDGERFIVVATGAYAFPQDKGEPEYFKHVTGTSTVISSDSRFMAVATHDVVTLYSVSTGQELKQIANSMALAGDPRGNFFVTAGRADYSKPVAEVRVHRFEETEPESVFEEPFSPGMEHLQITSVATNGQILATALHEAANRSSLHRIVVRDVKTGDEHKRIAVPETERSELLAMAISPDGSLLATGWKIGEDSKTVGRVIMWRINQ